MTQQEQWLWDNCLKDLPEDLGVITHRKIGEEVVTFYCHSAKTVIEICDDESGGREELFHKLGYKYLGYPNSHFNRYLLPVVECSLIVGKLATIIRTEQQKREMGELEKMRTTLNDSIEKMRQFNEKQSEEIRRSLDEQNERDKEFQKEMAERNRRLFDEINKKE